LSAFRGKGDSASFFIVVNVKAIHYLAFLIFFFKAVFRLKVLADFKIFLENL